MICNTPQEYEEYELIEINCFENFRDSSPTESVSIPRLFQPQYSSFFGKYLQANKPCVVAGATAGWKCAARWTLDNTVRHDYLAEHYGNLKVSISDCENPDRPSMEQTVQEYMAYLSGANGYRPSGHCWYLKDWHLRRERPNDIFYRVPSLFASDWLNEYALDKRVDDFMFVYIGPKGSWTPLHADVYSSFSWSANVIGCKRWLFLPPGEEQHLADSRGHLPREFHIEDHPQCLEVIQDAGDAVFVPSGWHHIVYNMSDTISINHNWVNGCNLSWVWHALDTALTKVECELDDLKNEDSFLADCQRVLKCDFGMDYNQFAKFLEYMASKRASQLSGEMSTNIPGGYQLGPKHILFDLHAALDAIDTILCDIRANRVLSSDCIAQLKLVTEPRKEKSEVLGGNKA